jgi:predicted esterase
MTREDRLNEIKDYINYLEDVYTSFDLDKFTGIVTALGFSQGSSTITRWVNASANRFNNLICYAGEVAPELLPLHAGSGLKRTKNYYICGTEDEFFTPALRQQVSEQYKELNFTEIIFEGKHVLNTDVLKPLINC